MEQRNLSFHTISGRIDQVVNEPMRIKQAQDIAPEHIQIPPQPTLSDTETYYYDVSNPNKFT